MHCGDIETNCGLEKATKVKNAAVMVVNYTEALDTREHVIYKFQKMVIGVGQKECDQLRERLNNFKTVFTSLQLLEKEQVSEIEPNVVLINGEIRPEPCIALAVLYEYSAVDFNRLAEFFAQQAQTVDDKNIQIQLGSHVDKIEERDGVFSIETAQGAIKAKAAVSQLVTYIN